MFDVKSITRWAATRKGVAAGVAILAVVASIAAIYSTFFRPPQTSPTSPPNVLWRLVIAPEMETNDLAITDANITSETDRGLLGLTPIVFYRYYISIKNGDGAVRQACSLVAEFSGPHIKRGGAILSVGKGPIGYNEDQYFMFDLPEGPTFVQTFFWDPHVPLMLNQLDWARVRVACRLPTVQASPWRDVDFSRIDRK